MKTLRDLYLKPFFKMYSCLLISFLIIFTILAAYFKFGGPFSKEGNNLAIGLLAGFLIYSPLFLYFVGNTFPKNVDWLINNHFNKKTLMFFYFINQTTRALVSASLYLFILGTFFFVKIFLDKGEGSFFDSWSLDVSALTLFKIIYYLGGFLLFLYFINLLFVGKEKQIVSMQAQKQSYMDPKWKKKYFLRLAGFVVCWLILEHSVFLSPYLLIMTFLGFFTAFGYGSFDRLFKLSKLEQRRKISFSLFALLFIPGGALYLPLQDIAKDPRNSTKERAMALVHLGPHLAPKILPEDFVGIIKGNKNNLYDLYEFGAQLYPFPVLLEGASSLGHLYSLGGSYLEGQISYNHLGLVKSKFKKLREKEPKEASYEKLDRLIRKFKANKSQIVSELQKNDKTSQFVGVTLANANLNLKERSELASRYVGSVHEEIKPLLEYYIKRAPAKANN